MRISPVCLYSTKKSFNSNRVMHQENYDATRNVSFKSAKAKGFGLGAFLGAITVTILSGGAAAPAVIAGYSAFTGAAAAAIGHAIDETKDKE